MCGEVLQCNANMADCWGKWPQFDTLLSPQCMALSKGLKDERLGARVPWLPMTLALPEI